MKTKTITVTSGWNSPDNTMTCDAYRVERVTDSLDFTPGKIIPKRDVESLCEHKNWKVTILPFPK